MWPADAGYALLLPNPRGSAGRGQTFARANLGDMGGGDLQLGQLQFYRIAIMQLSDRLEPILVNALSETAPALY